MAARRRSRRRYSLLVGLLQPAADAPVQDAERAIDSLLPKAPFQHREAIAHRLRALGARGGNAFEEFVARADHHLGGGGGSRGAQVGHEIGNRDIGLVAHRGDHRDRAGGDGARHRLFIERPQVFERSPAAADNHHVRPTSCG